MASGKSTLASALARECALAFVDLDDTVEAAAGVSIPEIFRTQGEEVFRSVEASALRRVAEPGAVIACGGGTPCFGDNLDFMLSAGTVVCLRASVDTIMRRLLEAPQGKRPLIDAYRDDTGALRERIVHMLAAREPFYSRAHADFDANRLDTADQIADSIALFRHQFKL